LRNLLHDTRTQQTNAFIYSPFKAGKCAKKHSLELLGVPSSNYFPLMNFPLNVILKSRKGISS